MTDNLLTLRTAPVPFLAVNTAEDRLADDFVARGAAEHRHGVVELLQQLHLPARRRCWELKERKYLDLETGNCSLPPPSLI